MANSSRISVDTIVPPEPAHLARGGIEKGEPPLTSSPLTTTYPSLHRLSAAAATTTRISTTTPPESPTKPDGPDSDAEAAFQPRSWQFWSVIVSGFLCLFLISLDRTIIGTAIPEITDEFHNLSDIGWYGSAYQLTTAATQFAWSKFFKFYDLKWTFLVAVFVFEAGSALCGAAPSSLLFILGRAIAGVGGAGIFSGVTLIIFSLVPLRKQPLFQGAFGGVFGLSSVLGPLVGGAFASSGNWRWCFYVNLPIGGVAIICVLFFLKPSQKPRERVTLWQQFIRLDPLGSLFFIPSTVSLLIALQWGGSVWEWGSWRIILLLVVFGVFFLAFVAVQILRPDTATVPPRIIKQRSILAASVFMFALAGALFMTIYFLPLWFQVVRGASAIQSGVYTLPLVISLVIAANIAGLLTKKIGYYVPAMIICPSLMAVGLGLMTTFRVNEETSHWIGYQFITGFGLGFGIQAYNLAARAVLPMADVPTGIAIIFFSQQLGGAIFTSVGQSLLSTEIVARLSGVPGVDASQVTSEGATGLGDDVPPEYQPLVKEAYNKAITKIFTAAMGVAVVAVIAALFMEWKNINTAKQQQQRPRDSEDDDDREPLTSSSSATTLGITLPELEFSNTTLVSSPMIISRSSSYYFAK